VFQYGATDPQLGSNNPVGDRSLGSLLARFARFRAVSSWSYLSAQGAVPKAWISERPTLRIVALTPVTVIKTLVVTIGVARVTVSPIAPLSGSEAKLTNVPSENVRVPDVIWSLRFGRSKSTTLLIV